MLDDMTDDDIRVLLLAVGLEAGVGPETYSSTFDALQLDSLARMEIASRIQSRYGLDIEELITERITPLDVKDIVNQRLAISVD
jgi:acyl carrier protein